MFKTKLSTFWQNNQDITNQPQYTCIEVLGGFTASVEILNKKFTCEETYKNQKTATNEAAKLACEYIDCLETKEQTCKLILIIDLDNQMNYLKKLPKDGSVQVIGAGSPRIVLPEIANKNFTLWKTKSTDKDAADVELIWYISENYKKFPKDIPIRICSGDYTLVNLARILFEKGFNCKWAPNIDDILGYIQ